MSQTALSPGPPRLRLASLDDAEAIDALMKRSIEALFPSHYDEAQTRSSETYIGRVDRMLIADGTYLVVEMGDELVACGGWSRRDKLYSGSSDQEERVRTLDAASEPARVRAMFVRPDRTRQGLGTLILEACEAAARAAGFSRLSLMATLPGVPLYQRFGFRVLRTETIMLPDGILLATASMEKPIRSSPARPVPQ